MHAKYAEAHDAHHHHTYTICFTYYHTASSFITYLHHITIRYTPYTVHHTHNNFPPHHLLLPPLGDAIKELWTDPGIQAVWNRRAEYQIIDSVSYYFNKIDLIKRPDYLPDKDDIIHSRVRTSGRVYI
ncbi:hypothetical protein EON63_03860 [archaeon]|nr:MAG: hypothetical protein EON63_03860 [archaeon]